MEINTEQHAWVWPQPLASMQQVSKPNSTDLRLMLRLSMFELEPMQEQDRLKITCLSKNSTNLL